MRLAYVDPEAYPSAAPAALQTWHTCVGLAGQTEAVWLVGGRGHAQAPAAFYGGTHPGNLTLRLLPRCRVRAGDVRLTWSLPFHVLLLLALRCLMRQGEIAAVLTRNLKLAHFLLRVHAWRPLPPIVFESHQLYGDVCRERAVACGQDKSAQADRLDRLEATVYRQAAGLLALTQQMGAVLPRRFTIRGPLGMVPDGVDARQALPRVPRSPDGPITYLGSFHTWKGVATPVQALAHAPALRLRLIGGAAGPRTQLAGLAQALHVADRVEFTGPVAPPTRWQYLAAASVCALPLARSVFGQTCSSPLKLFEYMAAARPIVASDLPVIREVLQDGRNALLVPPGDPPAWAAALQRLRADPALATRLGQQANEDVRPYTWEARGQRIVQFVGSLGAERIA